MPLELAAQSRQLRVSKSIVQLTVAIGYRLEPENLEKVRQGLVAQRGGLGWSAMAVRRKQREADHCLDGDMREQRLERRELLVVWPEVVPELRAAVRLINDKAL